jgi:hypothetical protein
MIRIPPQHDLPQPVQVSPHAAFRLRGIALLYGVEDPDVFVVFYMIG